MIESVREPSVSAGLIDRKTFDDGIRGLRRTAEDDGVFASYGFSA